MEDLDYMDQALALAREALAEGEVPVGCVITRGGEVVGRGRNRREKDRSALAHAEIEAIGEACRNLGGWRLWECTLYVTLEPCPMCAGAILNARIPRVVYGAADGKCGAVDSVCSLFSMGFNHRPTVEGGVGAEESAALLTAFFKRLRARPRTGPKWKRPGASIDYERSGAIGSGGSGLEGGPDGAADGAAAAPVDHGPAGDSARLAGETQYRRIPDLPGNRT